MLIYGISYIKLFIMGTLRKCIYFNDEQTFSFLASRKIKGLPVAFRDPSTQTNILCNLAGFWGYSNTPMAGCVGVTSHNVWKQGH